MKHYIVENGAVTDEIETCPCHAEWDGWESVLIRANSPQGALALAWLYDIGEIIADNAVCLWCGRTYSVVTGANV